MRVSNLATSMSGACSSIEANREDVTAAIVPTNEVKTIEPTLRFISCCLVSSCLSKHHMVKACCKGTSLVRGLLLKILKEVSFLLQDPLFQFYKGVVRHFLVCTPLIEERFMTDSQKANRERAQLLFKSLSKGVDDGGAAPAQPGQIPGEASPDGLPLTNAELVQLQTRVIALENLVIALLADASDWQRELAREGANYIRPKAGRARHMLTTHAADLMDHLVQRSAVFRVSDQP